MPKITGTGTPSVSGVPVPPQTFDQGQFFNRGEKDEPTEEQEGSPSVGTSSEQSSESSTKMPEKQSASGTTRRPARSTANRSK